MKRFRRDVAPLIRPFQAADLSALRRCVAAMQDFERTLEPRLRPGTEIAASYSDQLRARCAAESGAILLAAAGDEIIGFVAVQARVPFQELDEPPGEYALVSDLVVLAPHRRRGVGRALLAAAEQHARAQGAREIRVGALAGNVGARELYLAFGFRPSSEQLAKTLPAE